MKNLCYFCIEMPMVAPENIVEKVPANSICEACGREFSCGANVGECWCFAVELKAATLTELREKFKNCLCEDCLSQTKAPGITERR